MKAPWRDPQMRAILRREYTAAVAVFRAHVCEARDNYVRGYRLSSVRAFLSFSPHSKRNSADCGNFAVFLPWWRRAARRRSLTLSMPHCCCVRRLPLTTLAPTSPSTVSRAPSPPRSNQRLRRTWGLRFPRWLTFRDGEVPEPLCARAGQHLTNDEGPLSLPPGLFCHGI